MSLVPISQPGINWRERRAVSRVLKSKSLAQGSEVLNFEKEFSNSVVAGSECVAVNSGTSALHLALIALGVGYGDEVIVPSFTFAATANIVALTGAKPIFVDIDPRTFCISPEAVSSAVNRKTKAVIPVHLYGQPADMTAISNICKQHGLYLLEDAAQAHGSNWAEKPVATWGDVGAFSFYPTKNMTSGEGGMIVTSNETLARHVRLLRNQGQERKYENEIVGYNNRMTDIHACIGRVQLTKLPKFTKRRRQIAHRYDSEIQNVMTPFVDKRAFHVYHQYTIRVDAKDRDTLVQKLRAVGIETGIYYPIPVHRLPSFQQSIELPNTELVSKEVVSLPIYPSLSGRQVGRVIQAVNRITRAGS